MPQAPAKPAAWDRKFRALAGLSHARQAGTPREIIISGILRILREAERGGFRPVAKRVVLHSGNGNWEARFTRIGGRPCIELSWPHKNAEQRSAWERLFDQLFWSVSQKHIVTAEDVTPGKLIIYFDV